MQDPDNWDAAQEKGKSTWQVMRTRFSVRDDRQAVSELQQLRSVSDDHWSALYGLEELH